MSSTTINPTTDDDSSEGSNKTSYTILAVILVILVILIIAVVIVSKFYSNGKQKGLKTNRYFIVSMHVIVRRRRTKMLTLTTANSNRNTIKTDDSPTRSQLKTQEVAAP